MELHYWWKHGGTFGDYLGIKSANLKDNFFVLNIYGFPYCPDVGKDCRPSVLAKRNRVAEVSNVWFGCDFVIPFDVLQEFAEASSRALFKLGKKRNISNYYCYRINQR